MTPGRELDIAIGRHVMGDKGIGALIPEYSTRIESAMRVVERLALQGGMNRISIRFSQRNFMRDAASISHAICLAALESIEPGVES